MVARHLDDDDHGDLTEHLMDLGARLSRSEAQAVRALRFRESCCDANFYNGTHDDDCEEVTLTPQQVRRLIEDRMRRHGIDETAVGDVAGNVACILAGKTVRGM